MHANITFTHACNSVIYETTVNYVYYTILSGDCSGGIEIVVVAVVMTVIVVAVVVVMVVIVIAVAVVYIVVMIAAVLVVAVMV